MRRQSARQSGLPRFMGICLIAGYFWLLISLLLRVAGDLSWWRSPHRWGDVLNVLAVLLFLTSNVRAVVWGSANNKERRRSRAVSFQTLIKPAPVLDTDEKTKLSEKGNSCAQTELIHQWRHTTNAHGDDSIPIRFPMICHKQAKETRHETPNPSTIKIRT